MASSSTTARLDPGFASAFAALCLGAGLSVLPSREVPSDESAERPEGGAGEEEHDYLRFVPGDDPGEGELQTSGKQVKASNHQVIRI